MADGLLEQPTHAERADLRAGDGVPAGGVGDGRVALSSVSGATLHACVGMILIRKTALHEAKSCLRKRDRLNKKEP